MSTRRGSSTAGSGDARKLAASVKSWLEEATKLFVFKPEALSVEASITDGTLSFVIDADITDTSRVIGRSAEVIKAFQYIIRLAAYRNDFRGFCRAMPKDGKPNRFPAFEGREDWPAAEALSVLNGAIKLALGGDVVATTLRKSGAPMFETHFGFKYPDGVDDEGGELFTKNVRKVLNVIGKTQGAMVYVHANRTGNFEVSSL